METLFEAKRVMTKQLAVEIAKNTKPLSVYIYFILMFAIAIGANIYDIFYYFYYYGYFSIDILVLIPLLALIVYYFYRPYEIANRRIKNYKNFFKTDETDVYYFYDTFYKSIDINSKEEISIDYTRIADVKCTQNTYIIKLTDSKTMLCIPKNMFTKGIPEDFINFINSKIVNSKRKFK